MRRSQSSSYLPSLESGKDDHIVKVDFELPLSKPEIARTLAKTWETSDDHQFEEFTRAISLGLFDYLRKTRSKGFVVSLSGGADSAAVACLVAFAVRLGCKELGISEFAKRAGVSAPVPFTPEELVKRLLTTV